MNKQSRMALCLFVGALFASSGCGNDSGGASPVTSSQTLIAPNANNNTLRFYRGKKVGPFNFFQADAKPKKTLVGSNTNLDQPQAIHVDKDGSVYVVNDETTPPTPNSGRRHVHAAVGRDPDPLRAVVAY